MCPSWLQRTQNNIPIQLEHPKWLNYEPEKGQCSKLPFWDESVSVPKRKVISQTFDPYTQIVELIKGYKSHLQHFAIGGPVALQNAKYFLRASTFEQILAAINHQAAIVPNTDSHQFQGNEPINPNTDSRNMVQSSKSNGEICCSYLQYI